ncbi:MAG: MFS transporter [Deltaproteobacteria bacterium]|nr:MFS transporter [Deltaproteobacteria bacterium]
MSDAATARAPSAAALYLALVQFLFVTCWTLYVIFLPGLLETAGLSRRYVPWILILDQLTFMVMDVVTGVAADRAGRMLGRIGPLIIGLTTISCIAFLLIPHAAGWGEFSTAALLTLILVWTATSSALRAPPWVLLSRHAAAPSVPRMNALMLTGLAVGGALAPYLGITLKNLDPRLPFAASSLTLLATTVGLIWVERALSRQRAGPAPPPAASARLTAGSWVFAAGCLLLALGFQLHFSLNSAEQYLRVTVPERLPYLMPMFWIGSNLAMFPGAALARRYGTLPVIAAAALIGAAATLASVLVRDLDSLLAAQFTAGGAWGCILMASFSAALEYGRTGREGLALGLLFAALAGAALARIAAVAAEINKVPGLVSDLEWAPFVLWLAGAVLFAALASTSARRAAPVP